MDFIDHVNAISQQIQKLKDQVLTEEATKNAFILPLINALGYNVFNPMEVCPEFTADMPGLIGKKVDYAIIIDNNPAIFVECKWCGSGLENPKHSSQLHSYFHVTEAKFGVLTNGILYRFYTDIERTNVMDEKPFLSLICWITMNPLLMNSNVFQSQLLIQMKWERLLEIFSTQKKLSVF